MSNKVHIYHTRIQMNNVATGLFWKLMERFGVQGIQFILQIILARILDPSHYGMLSIIIIFVNLANVFIQNGFNSALIQNKNVDDDDYSSVFWVTLLVSIIVYVILYFCAPLIGNLYKSNEIVKPLRVIAFIVIPGAFNSIQLAKVSRDLDFKKVFFSNLFGVVISGVIGIIMAYRGYGLWALVVQNILNISIACLIMLFTVRWLPKFKINFQRLKILFSYGWKLLVSGLLDTGYTEARSLLIGYKYDSNTLGYYNRGKQFPQFIIGAVNGAVQSVSLPTFSKEQDNKERLKKIMRASIRLSSYVVFPLMIGFAAVATPFITIILTEKWLPCVIYFQIYCLTFAFYPIHSCNLQAINAVGRSDLFLILEIIKKIIGIGSIVFVVLLFDSPIAIALTGVFTSIISSFVNAYPNKHLINYSYFEQLKDMFLPVLMSIIMFICVYPLQFLNINIFVILLLQIIVGISVYITLSILFKDKEFVFAKNFIIGYMKKIFKKGHI